MYIPRDNGVMAKWSEKHDAAEERPQKGKLKISVGLMPLRRISPHIYSEAALRKSGLIWKTENGTGNVLPALRFAEKARHAPQMVIGDGNSPFSDMRLIKERMGAGADAESRGYYLGSGD